MWYLPIKKKWFSAWKLADSGLKLCGSCSTSRLPYPKLFYIRALAEQVWQGLVGIFTIVACRRCFDFHFAQFFLSGKNMNQFVLKAYQFVFYCNLEGVRKLLLSLKGFCFSKKSSTVGGQEDLSTSRARAFFAVALLTDTETFDFAQALVGVLRIVVFHSRQSCVSVVKEHCTNGKLPLESFKGQKKTSFCQQIMKPYDSFFVP